MKAIVKRGEELLFMEGNHWENLKDEFIINFKNKWTFLSNTFKKNTLIIETTEGQVQITFSAPVLMVRVEQYDKDQLIYEIMK
jgi:hypothetical protein